VLTGISSLLDAFLTKTQKGFASCSHVDHLILGAARHIGISMARDADCDVIDMGCAGEASLFRNVA
jgi:hypothetical protein